MDNIRFTDIYGRAIGKLPLEFLLLISNSLTNMKKESLTRAIPPDRDMSAH
jgi:hypothetical protein